MADPSADPANAELMAAMAAQFGQMLLNQEARAGRPPPPPPQPAQPPDAAAAGGRQQPGASLPPRLPLGASVPDPEMQFMLAPPLTAEDVEAATDLKADGDAAFLAGDVAGALAAWEAGAARLRAHDAPAAASLRRACQLAAAGAHLRLGGSLTSAWAAAEAATTEVLDAEPRNARALLLRGTARTVAARALAARGKRALLPSARFKAAAAVEDFEAARRIQAASTAAASTTKAGAAAVEAKLAEARGVEREVKAALAAAA
jgi:hypothetical protein